jgi:hypothetical protein
MKKVYAIFFISAFFTTIYASDVVAEYLYHNNQPYAYQSLRQGKFGMENKWYWADTVVQPVAGIITRGGNIDNGDYEYEIEPFFFQEFDYTPDTKIDILERTHPVNSYSVPTEGDAVFRVRYNDKYGNPVTDGYPKLILTYPDGSTQTYTMSKGADDAFSYKASNLPKGEYKYEYAATNEHYNYNSGFYRIKGEWYVTSRPYNFKVIKPVGNIEVMPDDAHFQWTISTDEENDVLKYELYIGTDTSKDRLGKYKNQPENNSTSLKTSGLEHMRIHHWYMRVTNKYGADLETKLFTFVTGGIVKKFYNAPNPFNPARGQETKFVFNMPQSGTADIKIYSEYGDKVWESEQFSFSGNTESSREIVYDGRDNSGRQLYNGTYIAVLTKKYGGSTKTEKCRILIIK